MSLAAKGKKKGDPEGLRRELAKASGDHGVIPYVGFPLTGPRRWFLDGHDSGGNGYALGPLDFGGRSARSPTGGLLPHN
uniref:Uncharacterized protein n=1 Tax=Oryza punctata TaxID=4537 RepID=A0A0E0LJ64_ORYPU